VKSVLAKKQEEFGDGQLARKSREEAPEQKELHRTIKNHVATAASPVHRSEAMESDPMHEGETS